MTEGYAAPLGATVRDGGVNFAVFSAHATRMTLCLFAPDGTETHRLDLPERDGDIWHGYVAGLRPGQLYGLRADGPYAPDQGHRFNPAKFLLDPYARRLTGQPVWDDALMGYAPGDADTPDPRDSAPYMPRCVVVDPAIDRTTDRRPDTPWSETVIYEAHVKGLTRTHPLVSHPGTFRALASDPVLDHLTGLGVTAIELLPVQAFLNDRFLVDQGLTNYWGYQPIGFFAPDPRYLSAGNAEEFRQMVDRLHAAGIEVILDVVYNHTGEGDETGPTLSFRGLDNQSYYRLADDPRRNVNLTGTGNTLNTNHPMVLRMILDSLRHWATEMGVDGFRFDLAPILGRGARGFDPHASLLTAIRQDPVLNRLKLIAEPWDLGPGGYQLGAFPAPFHEWNDRFRDGVRRFWRGDAGMAPDLAKRLTGSAERFDRAGRPATASVNLITSHDGFTLTDLVSYARKHNQRNGEANRDGHAENFSDNLGNEGPSGDPAITAARARRRRNFMATLLLSQGTPMILAGDELSRTQQGNNNAYNQDNGTSWIDWQNTDDAFHAFTRQMIAFRKAHPILRQNRFLHSRERPSDGREDLFWRRPDGQPMRNADWQDAALATLCAEMRMASGTPAYAEREDALFLVFNGGPAAEVTLPPCPDPRRWVRRLDTSSDEAFAPSPVTGKYTVSADSVAVFAQEPAA